MLETDPEVDHDAVPFRPTPRMTKMGRIRKRHPTKTSTQDKSSLVRMNDDSSIHLEEDLARCLVASGSTVLEGGASLVELFDQSSGDLFAKIVEKGLGERLEMLHDETSSIGDTSIEEDLVNLFVKKIEERMKARSPGELSTNSHLHCPETLDHLEMPQFKSEGLREAIVELASKHVALEKKARSEYKTPSKTTSESAPLSKKKSLIDSATSDSDSILSPTKTDSTMMLNLCPRSPTSRKQRRERQQHRKKRATQKQTRIQTDFSPWISTFNVDSSLSPQYSKLPSKKVVQRQPDMTNMLRKDKNGKGSDSQESNHTGDLPHASSICSDHSRICPALIDQRQVQPDGLSPKPAEERDTEVGSIYERQLPNENRIIHPFTSSEVDQVKVNAQDNPLKDQKPIPIFCEKTEKPKNLTVLTGDFSGVSDKVIPITNQDTATKPRKRPSSWNPRSLENIDTHATLGTSDGDGLSASWTSPRKENENEEIMTPLYGNCGTSFFGPLNLSKSLSESPSKVRFERSPVHLEDMESPRSTPHEDLRKTRRRLKSTSVGKVSRSESVFCRLDGDRHKDQKTNSPSLSQKFLAKLDPGEPGPSINLNDISIKEACPVQAPTEFTFTGCVNKVSSHDTSVSSQIENFQEASACGKIDKKLSTGNSFDSTGVNAIKKVRSIRNQVEQAKKIIDQRLKHGASLITSSPRNFPHKKSLVEQDIENALIGTALPSNQGSVFFRPTINIYNGNTTITHSHPSIHQDAVDSISKLESNSLDSSKEKLVGESENKKGKNSDNSKERKSPQKPIEIINVEDYCLDNGHEIPNKRNTVPIYMKKGNDTRKKLPAKVPALFDCAINSVEDSPIPKQTGQYNSGTCLGGNETQTRHDFEAMSPFNVPIFSCTSPTRKPSVPAKALWNEGQKDRIPRPASEAVLPERGVEVGTDVESTQSLLPFRFEHDESFVSTSSFRFIAPRQTPLKPDPPSVDERNYQERARVDPDSSFELSGATKILNILVENPIEPKTSPVANGNAARSERKCLLQSTPTSHFSNAMEMTGSDIELASVERNSCEKQSVSREVDIESAWNSSKINYRNTQEIQWKQRVSSRPELFQSSLAVIRSDTGKERKVPSVSEIVDRKRQERCSRQNSNKSGPLWESIIGRVNRDERESRHEFESRSLPASPYTRDALTSYNSTRSYAGHSPDRKMDGLKSRISSSSSSPETSSHGPFPFSSNKESTEPTVTVLPPEHRGLENPELFFPKSPAANRIVESPLYEIETIGITSIGSSLTPSVSTTGELQTSTDESSSISKCRKSFASSLTVDTPPVKSANDSSWSSSNTDRSEKTQQEVAIDSSSDDLQSSATQTRAEASSSYSSSSLEDEISDYDSVNFFRQNFPDSYLRYSTTEIPVKPSITVRVDKGTESFRNNEKGPHDRLCVSHTKLNITPRHMILARSKPQVKESAEKTRVNMARNRLARNHQMRKQLIKPSSAVSPRASVGFQGVTAQAASTPKVSNCNIHRTGLTWKPKGGAGSQVMVGTPKDRCLQGQSTSQASTDTTVYFD